MRSEFHKGYQSIEHLPFAASGGRFAKGTILSVRMAPFVSPKKRKGLLHRRGITIPAPLWARQSCRFLETGSLHPPLAALRRFPLTPRVPWISHFSVKCDTAFSKRLGLLLSPLSLCPRIGSLHQFPSISDNTTVLHYSGQKRFFPANSSLHAEFFRKFGVTHRVLPFGRPIRPVKDHKNRPAQ